MGSSGMIVDENHPPEEPGKLSFKANHSLRSVATHGAAKAATWLRRMQLTKHQRKELL